MKTNFKNGKYFSKKERNYKRISKTNLDAKVFVQLNEFREPEDIIL